MPDPAPSPRRTVALLSREYPPEIYGGAGVHVAELTRHLRNLIDVDVRTFGTLSEDAVGWRYAFAFLAPGPAFGIVAMLRLRAFQAS